MFDHDRAVDTLAKDTQMYDNMQVVNSGMPVQNTLEEISRLDEIVLHTRSFLGKFENERQISLRAYSDCSFDCDTRE